MELARRMAADLMGSLVFARATTDLKRKRGRFMDKIIASNDAIVTVRKREQVFFFLAS